MQLTPEFLPVGSIVEYNLMKHNKWTPIRLNATDILQCESDNKHFNTFHRPIPLTEKILTDWCGWELFRKQLSLNVGGELMEYATDDKTMCIYCSKKGWTLDSIVNKDTVYFHCVHQLQHLYSALTQTVLPIQIK